MAEERLTKDEYAQIMEHVKEGKNFLLSGGAGSGKTYTLVQVIRGLIKEHPTKCIACITYTNAAVEEIGHRVNHNSLHVSTIHDFLWDCICRFQKELRESLPHIINSERYKTKIKDITVCPGDYFFNKEIEKIEYKEYLNLNKGIISHDEILELAHYMFANYPKLCEIVKSRYPYILIDEYQDTSRWVVEIMLKSLSPKEKHPKTRQCIVGFFGDAMQSIYDTGIGNLDEYKSANGGHVYEVQKVQNRRNPKSVIDLANKLRTDGLKQEPSKDKNAPNMVNGAIDMGQITFLYSDTEIGYENIRTYIADNYQWDFKDSLNTKELNLTHNMIASKSGFPNLMDIFNGDKILEYVYKIKKEVANHSDEIHVSDLSLGEVIQLMSEKYGDSIVKQTPGQKAYIENHLDLWEKAKIIAFEKISKMYVEQDQLIDDKKQDEGTATIGSKRARVIRHLFKLQEIITLYNQNRLGEFLRATDKKTISSIHEKKRIKEAMIELSKTDGITLGDFIKKANELGIYPIDERLVTYMDKYSYVYERVSAVSYSEFLRYYDYMEGRTPFSTQHKTKGSEYNNVLVLMESSWNKYNFGYMMGERPAKMTASYKSVVNRTSKLFYVCCTRTKKHLIVFYSCPTAVVITKAKEWFGEENVIKIS